MMSNATSVKGLNSLMPVANVAPRMNTPRMNTPAGSSWNSSLLWFSALLIIFLALFAYFYDEFMDSAQNWSDSIRSWFTGKTDSLPPPTERKKDHGRPAAVPEEDHGAHVAGMEAIVEKVLPPAKDVFTVSKNEYTYYDAAPLCKALGAELATYDEVKHAWHNGADWCNYGWVKGQMAIYPTQKSSYEELQQGPADQRGVCGKPGVNGGYFDNPELKFGVTCSGKKPSQKDHDASSITRPLSASGIEFDKQVQKFKEGSETLGILPFNKGRWE